MKVTKEGIYRDKDGNELPVLNVGKNIGIDWFRAYWQGGYYDVNENPEEKPYAGDIEWEMVEFVRDLKDSE